VARENVETRLEPRIEETAQTETQSAGGAGARFRCRVGWVPDTVMISAETPRGISCATARIAGRLV